MNAHNGVPKSVNDLRYWGGTVGGPVGKPGRDNRKLFFFVSEQVQPDQVGGAVNYFRVPTALERQGNFSQTLDNNNNLFNTIADTTTGLPCTSTNASGCFPGGIIPPSRLYSLGLSILNQYPMPNTQGVGYNLVTVSPNVTTTNYQHVIRADYNVSTRLRISGKYAGQNTSITPVIGSIPGYNDRLTQFPGLIVPSATVVFIVNPTTVIEGSFGYTRGDQLGTVASDPASNRCTALGTCNFPELFPDSLDITKGSYQDKVLTATKAPFYVNGVAELQPDYTWGNRIANPPPNNYYPPYLNWQYTIDSNVSITKVWGCTRSRRVGRCRTALKCRTLAQSARGRWHLRAISPSTTTATTRWIPGSGSPMRPWVSSHRSGSRAPTLWRAGTFTITTIFTRRTTGGRPRS